MRVSALLFSLTVFAQDQTFRGGVRFVQVPVTVTNEQGAFVDGLKARDFQLLDNGEERAISLDTFGTGAAPISLAVAVETSAFSRPALPKIRRIGSMIQPLVIGRRGEAAVLTFGDEIDWRLDFTSDSDAILKTIKSLPAGIDPQSRLLDAVMDVADAMKERKGRRVLLLISESRDRGSRSRLEDAIRLVEREGIEVFAATFSAQAQSWTASPEDLPPPAAPDYMAVFSELARAGKTNHTIALTRATGGADYPFLRARSVEKAVEMLGVDVHAQYILGFREPAGAGGMHRIDVRLPDRGDVRIRARQAYWAENDSPAK